MLTSKEVVLPKGDDKEYPKWVKVDNSLVEKQNDEPIVPTFDHWHVDRVTKEVTVLCHTKADEDRARAGKAKPAPVPAPVPHKDEVPAPLPMLPKFGPDKGSGLE